MKWLVETEWLAANLDRADLCIVDVRGDTLPPVELGKPVYIAKREAYALSHIPGATFIDWTKDITDPDDPIPVQIAPPERFAEAMSRIGVGPETLVVTYDDHNNIMAARLWWALRYYGHDKVAVLNGGWPKWISEGRTVTANPPDIARAVFIPHIQPELHKVADQILPDVAVGALLIDNRTPTDFTGETQRAKRGGHIPGALSLQTANLLDENKAVIGLEALQLKLEEAGLPTDDLDQPLITYCNGGVNASLVALALSEAGYNNVAVYDGSWNEWGNDPTRPVEMTFTPAEPPTNS